MDHAGGGDEFIGPVALDVEEGARSRNFKAEGPDVESAHGSDESGVVKVELNSSQLRELGDFPILRLRERLPLSSASP